MIVNNSFFPIRTSSALTVLSLGNELEGQGVPAGGSTISAGVVGAVHSAVGRAALVVLANGRVPRVAVVAVGVAVLVVNPSPVGIDGDLSVHVGARAPGAALLPSHLGVRLGRLLAHLLGNSRAHEGGGENEGLGEHLEQRQKGKQLL